jgi:hypothetical protein
MRIAGYLKLPFSGLRMLLIKIQRQGIRVSNRSTWLTRSALQDHPERGAAADFAFELDPPLCAEMT